MCLDARINNGCCSIDMQKRSISEADGITKCEESLRIFSEAKHVVEFNFIRNLIEFI
jgi:hypothetical protein